MPVHRAEIGKAHILEHRRIRQQRLFKIRLQVVVKIVHRAADRVAVKHITVGLFEFVITGLRAQQAQMLAHRADVAVNRHPVVVQDDDERLAARARVVQPLVGKAAGERAVADEREHGIVPVQKRARLGHAERHGDGVGRMARNERVMLALVWLREAGESLILPQRREPLPPTGQNFMRVALMPHVEHQPVARRIEHTVDGHRQLDRTEIGRQMPARPGDIFQQKFTQLCAKKLRLRVIQRFDIVGVTNGFKNQCDFLLYLPRCSTDSAFAVR